MQYRPSDAVALALLVVAAVAGVAVWPSLPAEMAIHFDASGTPDNFVSKPVAVFLTPAIGLGTVVFMRAVAHADPSADQRTLSAAVVFVSGIIAYVHGLVLTYNLGYDYDMTIALVPVFLATAALVGYAFYREGYF
jgi:uncharacterized membrane protein